MNLREKLYFLRKEGGSRYRIFINQLDFKQTVD